MPAPLILCHDNWPELIASLAQRPGLTCLQEISPQVASAVLAAPAAVARWVALQMPRLAGSRAWSLLVIGAETTDAPDQGRWYQLLPQLLDSAAKVEVTLIGEQLDGAFASAAATHAPAVPAHCHRIGLADFLRQNQPVRFDLAVVFQPGLQKHRAWLADAGFGRLLAAGTEVIGSSYETDEYEMDRWVLECHGYRVSAQPVLNPLVLELSDGGTAIRWGRALWQMEAAPPPGFRIDTHRLDALDTLTRMVMHSMTTLRVPTPACGAEVELRAADGRRLRLVHVFDNRFTDVATGRLSLLAPEGELQDAGVIPPEAVARYPGAHARDIERAVWAADVKSRYLLASYPREAAVADAAATARGMFNALRGRAARLFGK